MTVDSINSKIIYFIIIAIAITNFIVRLKVFKNIRNFDMSMIPNISNLFTYYKLTWLIIVSIILVLVLIYRMYMYKQKLELNFILLGTGLIILAAMVSFILDPIQEVTIWGLYSRSNGLLAYIFLFLLIYLISNLKVQSKHIFFLVHTINIASIILVIIGIFQFFGLDMMDSLWFKQFYTPSEYKYMIENINITSIKLFGMEYYIAPSILGQFNYFGAYCSIIYPFVTAFALNEDNIIKKILLIIGSIMLFTGTILAQSMGSTITMFLALLLIPIFLVNKRNYKIFMVMCFGYTIISAVINRLSSKWAFYEIYKYTTQVLSSKLLAIVILMLIIYILLFIFRSKISKYRYSLVSIFIILALLIGAISYIYIINNVAEQNMGILSNRGYIWHYSNELIKDNFIFGYGPDNLFYNFPQINPHSDQFMPNNFVDKPHNMYLQVLLDTGIFGLIGFMILLIGLLLKANKAIDLETDLYKNTFLKALMLVITAYMIQGIVNDNHLTVQPTVYLIMGIGASLIKQTLDKAKLDKLMLDKAKLTNAKLTSAKKDKNK
ncbi:MAG: hypothetical protein A2Y23_08035 [Clostridiales bacterium GWB2_37_7]|nr:MAG: hypothetical protein A2Y23_08035 [Clostridiales bacterium GWB2_37_7]